MKYIAKYTNQFRKDFKLCIKRGYNMQLLKEIMLALENGEELIEKAYKDSEESGRCYENYVNFVKTFNGKTIN